MADQRLVVLVEVEKNERKYSFSMPVGAPLGEAYDAAFDVLKEIVELAKGAAENAKNQNSNEPQVEVVNN